MCAALGRHGCACPPAFAGLARRSCSKQDVPRSHCKEGPTMSKPMKIDFVSDVSCPWCVIGLRGLEAALARVGDLVQAEIHFQPFELNPDMPPGGQNIVEHIAQKYSSSPEQSAAARENIRARAAEVGFTMAMGDESRIYNTFDAHRLLHWAGCPVRRLFHERPEPLRSRDSRRGRTTGRAGWRGGEGCSRRRPVRRRGSHGGTALVRGGDHRRAGRGDQ